MRILTNSEASVMIETNEDWRDNLSMTEHICKHPRLYKILNCIVRKKVLIKNKQQVNIWNYVSQKKSKSDPKVNEKMSVIIVGEINKLTTVRFSSDLSVMPTTKESTVNTARMQRHGGTCHIPSLWESFFSAKVDFLKSYISVERRGKTACTVTS